MDFIASKALLPLALVALVVFPACNEKKGPVVSHDVNLYAGIRGIASLGDSENQMLKRSKAGDSAREAIDEPDLEKLHLSHFFAFKDSGAQVYFRNGRVVLIMTQEPFRGTVQGKNLKLFSFGPAKTKTWADILARELGEPLVRVSGGKFGSEAFFYSWGDISFNRMGPNQLAIYRDADISSHRLKHFGRGREVFLDELDAGQRQELRIELPLVLLHQLQCFARVERLTVGPRARERVVGIANRADAGERMNLFQLQSLRGIPYRRPARGCCMVTRIASGGLPTLWSSSAP